MYRVVVADPLHQAGLAFLRRAGAEVIEVLGRDRDPAELKAAVADADALLVRSGTKVDAELLAAGARLQVVARAGTGVDNVDLDKATELGIVVVNAPTANSLSAAELTLGLLFALARKLPAADASLKAGGWDRKRFMGSQLYGKTLGIIGLGRIGRRVAARAEALEMEVVAYDPFVSQDQAGLHGARLLELDALLARADVVTLHTPLTAKTRGLINAERIARMKPGAWIVNAARGGLIDEGALLAALESGHLGGAALDVFAEEPPWDLTLIRHPKVVATPHLGAQTAEGQEQTAIEIAHAVLAVLGGALAETALNLPFAWNGNGGNAYLLLGDRLGLLAAGILAGDFHRVEVALEGVEDSLELPVSLAAARGAMRLALGRPVSFVNVESLAHSFGIEIAHAAAPANGGGRPAQVRVSLVGAQDRVVLSGTLQGGHQPWVTHCDDTPMELCPEGELLVLRSPDPPRALDTAGAILAAAGVEVGRAYCAKLNGGSDAWSLLCLDEKPDPVILDRLDALPTLRSVRLLQAV